MSKSALIKTIGWIAAILFSYVACFGILALLPHQFSFVIRLGLASALACSAGVGVYSWARILATVARKREWSIRNCQMAGLLVIVPGAILLLAGCPLMSTANVLLQQALWTGLLCTKLVYPNFATLGPFERDEPTTIIQK